MLSPRLVMRTLFGSLVLLAALPCAAEASCQHATPPATSGGVAPWAKHAAPAEEILQTRAQNDLSPDPLPDEKKPCLHCDDGPSSIPTTAESFELHDDLLLLAITHQTGAERPTRLSADDADYRILGDGVTTPPPRTW